jgi:outer membrane protein assembly factor BamB
LGTRDETWRTSVAVPVRSAATVALGKVFVIGHNNTFFALNAETGRLAWTHSSIEERLALFGGGSAAVDVEQNVVLVPYSSGEIYAIDAKTGRHLWSDALSVSKSSDLYSSLIDIEAAPVISEKIAYAINHNGALNAYYMPNGRKLWSKEMSATQMPWIAGNVMYVTTDTGEISCINRVDGKVRWVKKLSDTVKQPENGKLVWSAPILAGKRIFVTSNTGQVIVLHPVSGEIKGQLNLKSSVTLPPLVVNNTLVFYTDDARIITFK